ncbi:hypothetical protein B0H63DRAFT_445621 [Podospora didyma]|uniref:Uncharacterized protein n=1 Tax=Podospora didyma TaxID=330526 RepID=A0AAE0NX88_9PEZI|nr:hypothetical protein B0H63DRAFT_445621 [Podospora didyma]
MGPIKVEEGQRASKFPHKLHDLPKFMGGQLKTLRQLPSRFRPAKPGKLKILEISAEEVTAVLNFLTDEDWEFLQRPDPPKPPVTPNIDGFRRDDASEPKHRQSYGQAGPQRRRNETATHGNPNDRGNDKMNDINIKVETSPMTRLRITENNINNIRAPAKAAPMARPRLNNINNMNVPLGVAPMIQPPIARPPGMLKENNVVLGPYHGSQPLPQSQVALPPGNVYGVEIHATYNNNHGSGGHAADFARRASQTGPNVGAPQMAGNPRDWQTGGHQTGQYWHSCLARRGNRIDPARKEALRSH